MNPQATLLFVFMLVLPVFGGCATLSKGECLTANWYLIGRNDGAQGYPRSRLHEHRQACVQYGVIPDAEAYFAGRRAGLQQYCTPRNGFREGVSGAPYHGVCRASSERAFLQAYRKGKAVHEVTQQIEAVENTIDTLRDKLADDSTPDASRDRIRTELRARFRELRHLRRRLTRLERRFDYNIPYYVYD